jgi:hypothetical protein
MTEHKHAALIKAWAEGAKIQKFSKRTQVWEDTEAPTWNEDTEYRLRISPDYVIEVNANVLNGEFFIDVGARFPNLSLVFDAKTNYLKSADLIRWRGKK